MTEVGALLFDVGGVLGNNGWDRNRRREVAEHFDLGWDEFAERHDLVVAAFEEGRLTLDEYLSRTVFSVPRSFSREDFAAAMYDGSRPYKEAIAFVAALGATNRYKMATLNNESRELNEHRIERFGLRDHFGIFLSSCYLGTRKPNPEIFEMALGVIQCRPAECVFIDDRLVNIECAGLQGMTAIHFTGIDALRGKLASLGVAVAG